MTQNQNHRDDERAHNRRRLLFGIVALLLLLLLFGWSWYQKRPATKPLTKASTTQAPKSAKRAVAPGCKPSGREVCDGKDNDCDGQIDEGYHLGCEPCKEASARAKGCLTALLQGGAWSQGKARNLLVGNDRGVALPRPPQKNPYIYIANSLQGTVSKLRTKDGVEVGRFFVGHNPSRTAVDANGDAWVAMRGSVADHGQGRVLENVVKIDGKCTPKIKPPQSTRECILLDIPDVSNLLRGIAVDITGDVWVGSYMRSEVLRLDGRTGLILRRIPVGKGFSPYGLAVDERGFVWVASRSGGDAVVRIDPLSERVDLRVPIKKTRNTRPYGIASDGQGGIWLASNGPYVYQLDGRNGKLLKHVVAGKQTRGLAVDPRGFVWVADSRANALLKLSHKEGKLLGTFPVGKSPVGVAVAHDGGIWAVNLISHNATRLSVDGQVLGTYAVGKSPYTYSDMTGTAFHVFRSVQGRFRGRYATGIPGARWVSMALKAAFHRDAKVKIRARAADDKDELEAQPWKATQLVDGQIPLDLRGGWIELDISMMTRQPRAKGPCFVQHIRFFLYPR